MKKIAVEDCLVLDINTMLRSKLIQYKSPWNTTIYWRNGSAVDVSREFPDGCQSTGLLRLNFTAMNEPIEHIVLIDMIYTKTGRRLWWFLCPIQSFGNDPCLRKAKKLYLPPGAKYFGCRDCYSLSYRSRQCWATRKKSIFIRGL